MLAQAVPSGQTSFGAPQSTWMIIVAVVIIAVIVAVIAARNRRRAELHQRFGPEYDRTVQQAGSQQRAEAELAERERRHRTLHIRPLTPGARDRYAEQWRGVQARFVDAPAGAVGDADRLVTDVMRDRGYPVGDDAQRADDLSVEHARVVDNYRFGRDVAMRTSRGDATTEELRRAMVAYRALFADLLDVDPVAANTATPKG
ncbi:MAG TPA: hypothetical protein VE591_04640 [Candidatus Acidoferrum sp.]|nr:hypothetical protein [Candidatus Acidoferrum sp.]